MNKQTIALAPTGVFSGGYRISWRKVPFYYHAQSVIENLKPHPLWVKNHTHFQSLWRETSCLAHGTFVTGFEKTRQNAHIAQCVFLVPQVKICQSPVFVISMSKNLTPIPSRVNVSYQGKISLHFELPCLYSCRTRSPLFRALIRIPVRGLSRYS